MYGHFKDKYSKEKAGLEFRFRKIDEIRNYPLEKTKHYDLIRKENKKTCKYLNYFEHLLIRSSVITGCISISVFALLVCVPVSMASSVVGINFCAITAGIKTCKAIIKKIAEEA